jgi:hypothetical protein
MSVLKTIKLEPDVWKALRYRAFDGGVTMRKALDEILRDVLKPKPQEPQV